MASLNIVQVSPQPAAGLNFCPTCIQFMNDALNNLLGILQKGVVLGGCAEVCRKLPNSIEVTVCDLLCTVVGLEEFSKLVNDADPDPIWLCSELHACASRDNAAANITALTSTPTSGQQGTTYDFEVTFKVINETGAGQMELAILPPDGLPFGDSQLIDNIKPGTYTSKFTLKTQPSEEEPFFPGDYQVVIALCEGACGGKHSGEFTIAQSQTKFQITG